MKWEQQAKEELSRSLQRSNEDWLFIIIYEFFIFSVKMIAEHFHFPIEMMPSSVNSYRMCVLFSMKY